jgi:hypothetical protein
MKKFWAPTKVMKIREAIFKKATLLRSSTKTTPSSHPCHIIKMVEQTQMSYPKVTRRLLCK